MIKALSLSGFFTNFSLSRENSFVAHRLAKSKTVKIKTWQPALAGVLIAVNLLLGLAYVLGVNGYAATGYEIKKLQSQLSQLSEENRKLSLQVSESSSIVSTQASLPQMNFVPAGTPKFVEISAITTALK